MDHAYGDPLPPLEGLPEGVQERAAGADLPDEAINGVKSSLMGPLAGVGDSMIQGLVTPLLLSLGIDLARRGNLAGPVLYVLLITPVIIGSMSSWMAVEPRRKRSRTPSARGMWQAWQLAVARGG